MGISANTVLAGLQSLEKFGVSNGFRHVVDLKAAGVPVQAFVALELDQRELARVLDELREPGPTCPSGGTPFPAALSRGIGSLPRSVRSAGKVPA
jgi:DNA-binding Lrp family transcriptional regulator